MTPQSPPESSDAERPRVDRHKLVRAVLRSIPFMGVLPGPELYDIVVDLRRSRTQLGGKVRRASQALEDASKLVAELEEELSERAERVAKLRAEYEKYEQLAQIEEGKAEAIIRQLSETLDERRSQERWIALGINLIAGLIVFALGVWLAPWVRQLLGVAG